MKRWLAVVLSILVAGILLNLAVPRLLAGLAMLPGNEIKTSYFKFASQEGPPSSRELEIWRASREQALAYVDLVEARGDLAIVDLIEASKTSDHAQSQTLRAQARNTTLDALRLSPSDGLLWLRLAALDNRLADQPTGRALDALAMSIAVDRYEPNALELRLRLGLRNWDDASPTLQAAILDQMSLLGPAREWDLIRDIALNHPERIPELRERLEPYGRAMRVIREAEKQLGSN